VGGRAVEILHVPPAEGSISTLREAWRSRFPNARAEKDPFRAETSWKCPWPQRPGGAKFCGPCGREAGQEKGLRIKDAVIKVASWVST